MRTLQFFSLFLLYGLLSSQSWVNIGPVNRQNLNNSNGQGAGRMKSIAFHPDHGKNTPSGKTVFATSIHGGVWVSVNDGQSWSNSHPDYPGLNTDALPAIGVREVLPKMENGKFALYALLYHGNGSCLGVMRYDKNNGWQNTGLAFAPLDKKILYGIYHFNERIFVCGEQGILFSDDKGASWNPCLDPGSELRVRNLSVDPANAKTIWAFGDQVWKSSDGGKNWSGQDGWKENLSHVPHRIMQSYGVCSDSGEVFLSVIYTYKIKKAEQEAEERQYDMLHYKKGMWMRLPMFGRYIEWQIDRQVLALSPDFKFLYAGQECVQRLDIQKKKWMQVSDYGTTMHPDIHDLEFSGDGRLWVAHDGGISVSAEPVSEVKPKWNTIINGISSATLWSFSVSPTDPKIIFTGEVDNGNTYTTDGVNWYGYMLADGGEKLLDYSDSGFVFDRNMMYANSGIFKHRIKDGKLKNGGTVLHHQRLAPHLYEDWGTPKPMVQDPKRPYILYRGGINGLLRSTEWGLDPQMIFSPQGCAPTERAQWQTVVSVIEIFPLKPDVMFVNTCTPYDTTKMDGVFRTKKASRIPYNDGKGCTNPTYPRCECDFWQDISPHIPGNFTTWQKHRSHITGLAVHDKKPNILYAGFTFNPYIPKLKVMKWEFNVWNDYSEGIPEWTSVRAIEFIPGTEGTVFIGTDDGIFYRTKTMLKWERYGSGMPNVKVMGLQYVAKNKSLYAGTYGRGIWKVEVK